MATKPSHSKKFLDEMRALLEEQKQKTDRQLADLQSQNGPTGIQFPDYGEGEDENAEEVATYDTNLQLIDALTDTLRDTSDALKRMDDETYGICKYCKKPIDEQRLRARPTSSSCVACKKTLTQEL